MLFYFASVFDRQFQFLHAFGWLLGFHFTVCTPKWCTPIFYDLRTLAVVPSGAPTGTNRGSIG
ncbi:hypothetical protein HanXRQr2_Chr10g0446421 [Helianthus annuus]|uniref:Uncharacterized protein n=1 Tax=Helianthus annuus TaxID=4232 RepID=A0A251TKQ4_HELAN|nr:hypothetical protein HanXRQr2_Chr10g0446421 [Helianthus annuus]